MSRSIAIVLLLLSSSMLLAQEPSINPSLLKDHWRADWITISEMPARAYGVYHFRKTIGLPAKPSSFIVHVTADNRYRLYVNGMPVCNGPARGDLYNWYFETVDLAPFLKAGENVIAALVWNMGEHAAVAQISNQTAFVLQGNGSLEAAVNTDESWKVYRNEAYTPCSLDNMEKLNSYMVIGPGDHVKAALYPWGWEKPGYDDTKWLKPVALAKPAPAGYGTDNRWTLVPRSIPLMEERFQPIPVIRKITGIKTSAHSLDSSRPLVIPANTTASILFDQTYNTVAYPELIASGGKNAVIRITYAEALFKDGKKGNRNEIEGKEMIGNYDVYEMDGGDKRLFRPLWLRTFRYVRLDITTAAQPLTINDFYGQFTGYPFEEKATFSSNDPSLQRIWDVGWRTARLCAGETYYDCPYYEQLQYEGDTRIQSLISLYVSGDDRLMRKAINDFYNSRVPEGLTQGRYPSNRLQVIPPFSLHWVSMLYDYWMHRRDDAFIGQYLHAVRGVLEWYEKNMDNQKGMLGPMKWWGFVDWNTHFPNGVPDGATDGNSSIISLHYAYSLQQAAALFAYFGKSNESAHYTAQAKKITESVYRRCFDKQRGSMANTPGKKAFSQHANIIGVLSGSVPAAESRRVMQMTLSDSSLSQATYYYRFYLTLALKKAGMADLYYSQLKPWRDMLDIGLTTFAEEPEPSRSDCHAWSSSPNYDFLATLCGIMPASPGFATVAIAPHLGELQSVSGSMPHPLGTITVSINRKGRDGIEANIVLPDTVSGKFIWQGKERALKGGAQKISL